MKAKECVALAFCTIVLVTACRILYADYELVETHTAKPCKCDDPNKKTCPNNCASDSWLDGGCVEPQVQAPAPCQSCQGMLTCKFRQCIGGICKETSVSNYCTYGKQGACP